MDVGLKGMERKGGCLCTVEAFAVVNLHMCFIYFRTQSTIFETFPYVTERKLIVDDGNMNKP